MMSIELWVIIAGTILVALTGVGFLLWGWKISRI
jgi:hypothetical protein